MWIIGKRRRQPEIGLADKNAWATSAHPTLLTRLNLRRNDIARNRHRILLRHPILRPTQQHIAALPPLKPPQETSVFGKKRQIHIIFAAKPKQKRRHQHIAETENMPDGMHRQLRHLLTLHLHHQRLPLFMQIAALGGDIERVLQFAHGKLLQTLFVYKFAICMLKYYCF